jgi:hypothetical protein
MSWQGGTCRDLIIGDLIVVLSPPLLQDLSDWLQCRILRNCQHCGFMMCVWWWGWVSRRSCLLLSIVL